MEEKSLLDTSNLDTRLNSKFSVLVPSKNVITQAGPVSKIIGEDLPLDFFLTEDATFNVDGGVDDAHGLKTRTKTFLQPNVQAIGIDNTAFNAVKKSVSTPGLTFNTTGNVAAAVNLNKGLYYIGTLSSCCGHYLHQGHCEHHRNCFAKPSRLCPDFNVQACPVLQVRHGEFLHISLSCKTALEDGDCFDNACTQGHDNFGMRRRKEDERKKEAAANIAQWKREHSGQTQNQIQAVEMSLRQSAKEKQVEQGKEASFWLEQKLDSGYLEELVMNGQLRLKGAVEGVVRRHTEMRAAKVWGDFSFRDAMAAEMKKREVAYGAK